MTGYVSTPIGDLQIVTSNRGVVQITFVTAGAHPRPRYCTPSIESTYLEQAKRQLFAYLIHERTTFTVPVSPDGTVFEQRVWRQLQTIPFGKTTSYGDVARAMGQPGAAQAVGQAVGSNPIAICIPCHRVLPANGSLGGYAAGPDRKRWLLEHESKRRSSRKMQETSRVAA